MEDRSMEWIEEAAREMATGMSSWELAECRRFKDLDNAIRADVENMRLKDKLKKNNASKELALCCCETRKEITEEETELMKLHIIKTKLEIDVLKELLKEE